MNEIKLTPLSEIGEFAIIEKIKKETRLKHNSTLAGIGDDAAVIDRGNDTVLLLSTDLMAEGVHFDLSYSPLKHLGYKAVAINVSDIAAMNAIPREITVSLAMSSRFTLEAINELYQGIHLACDRYKLDLVGGDTTSSQAGLIISVSITGYAEKKEIVYRNGAKENNLVCVTGNLGAAYTGLQILEREKRVFSAQPNMQPELKGYEYVLKRQLKPEARTDIIEEFRKLQIKPTSMIDISDGLASEALHLAKESGAGIDIYEEKLPADSMTVRVAQELNIPLITCLLNGGEDYELLFTIDVSAYDKIKNHADISIIGKVNHASLGNNLHLNSGQVVALKAQGWKHF